MTARLFLLATLASSALAACAPAEKKPAAEAPTAEESVTPAEPAAEEPVAEASSDDQCMAAEYQSLVGSNVAAVSLPADLVHRIYKEGDAITMDYRPDRLNIVTDENGVIIEVKCG